MAKNRILIFAALLALMCSTANTHRHYHGHYQGLHYLYPHRVTTVIKTLPDKRVTVVSRVARKDRFDMAVAYLKANQYMTVKQYAKVTGLKKDIAEAELNVFAQDALNPIKLVQGKKNFIFS